MKQAFFILTILALAAGCLSENGAKPGNSSTWIRYFSGGYDDQAVTVEQADDGGFIILANSKIQASEAEAPLYRIKLIRTDAFGNTLWQSVLNQDTISHRSAGLGFIPGGGYVIAGSDIQRKDTTSKVLIMKVDTDGKLIKKASIPQPGIKSIDGRAVTVDAQGRFIVLCTSGNADMHLMEIDPDALVAKSFTSYAAGKTTLANRIYGDVDGKSYLWSGTVTKTDATNVSNVTGVRVVKSSPDAINAYFDLTLINPCFSETASDFCRYGFGYAVIGSTNQKKSGPGDYDIMYKLLGSGGTVLIKGSFPMGDNDNNNDSGNSISSTQDGGLILLGTVNSASINGRGDDDYMLIKLDPFGNEVWRQHFGSRYKDAGVSVRQAADGGFVVLGTTTQGQLDIVMLAKTDKDGKIE